MATPRRDALTRFTDELNHLRTLAGSPPLKDLVALTATLDQPLARSTISDKLAAKSVPGWEFVVSFVTGCRAYADSTGVPLPPGLVDLSRWEAAHWRMLSDLDSASGERRLATAARSQLSRDTERGEVPGGGTGQPGVFRFTRFEGVFTRDHLCVHVGLDLMQVADFFQEGWSNFAVVLERRAVPLIRAGPGDGVDGDAVAAELRAIRVRQHLVLGDRLDAERGSQLPGTAAAVPVVLHVGVVHQEHLSFRTRTRHGVLRLPSEELLERAAGG